MVCTFGLIHYFWCVGCASHEVCLSFFFFKQKTAYEMRISDWSSDVCSSDLLIVPGGEGIENLAIVDALGEPEPARIAGDREGIGVAFVQAAIFGGEQRLHLGIVEAFEDRRRSEEHTSELQSLMRISYAVFCLKKKTQNNGAR